MTETSGTQLSQELAALSDGFADLGERMLHAARQLHAPGAPPPQRLIDELADGRRGFLRLGERARDLAETLHVAPTTAESIDSIQGLAALLDTIAESEIRRDRNEEVRYRALSVLDRVVALSHGSDPDFPPLKECQDQAHGLRSAVADASWHEPRAESERLADGSHGFASLLTLIEHHDDLTDEDWASLHDAIVSAFGKPLAVAAARSKLTLERHDEGENGHLDAHEVLGAPTGR